MNNLSVVQIAGVCGNENTPPILCALRSDGKIFYKNIDASGWKEFPWVPRTKPIKEKPPSTEPPDVP